MTYVARTHVAPGDLGTSADQNQGMDNEAALWPYTAAGQIAVATSASALTAKIPGWNPDSLPSSPGALDDEFADGTLGGAWTEYDPDTKTTWTEGNGGATATVLTTATLTMNGIHQALPAGDFTVWMKAALLSTEVAGTYIGIQLWEDPAGDNKQFQVAHFRDATAGFVSRMIAQTWTNRSTVDAVKCAAATYGYDDSLYLRLRRNVANYYVDISRDGLGWRAVSTAITLTFTPTKIGIGVLNYNTLVTQTMLCPFFRYVASDVGLAGVMAGNRC